MSRMPLRPVARITVAGLAALAATAILAATASPAAAVLTTDDLAGGAPTPTQLAESLAGAGVTVSNVTHRGADTALGLFAGGGGIIGFEDGVILSSGAVAGVVGPNNSDSETTAHPPTSGDGDSDLDALGGSGAEPTEDAAVLEFDLVPGAGTLTFSYVFSSDEYNDFVGSAFNDIFAFFVNGQNCALVPGTGSPVSINTINGGNPFGMNATNAAFYRNNDLGDGGGSIDTEMDGLTVVLTCTAAVNPGQTNHVKLAIADRTDSTLDSNVFLQRGSFVAPPPAAPPIDPGVPGAPDRESDGVPDATDNCPDAANPDQADRDRDRIGDVCDSSDASVPPEVGETVIARVVSGEVFFRPPGSRKSSRSRAGARASQTPAGFTPVRGAAVIPVGSTVHTTRGRLAVTSVNTATAGGRTMRTQTADFYRGIFQIKQARARRPVTELSLRSTNFRSVCGSTSRGATANAAQQRRSRVVSRLWGNGRGRFRTRGRHSAATVRGTVWLTQERCDGTLTQVTRGSVSVRDLRARRTVTVRAGRSYLARARRATVRRR